MLSEFCNQKILSSSMYSLIEVTGKESRLQWVVEEITGKEMEKSIETNVFNKICL